MEQKPTYEEHDERVANGEKHVVTKKKIGSCLHEYTCETCGATWVVDTSD